MRIAGFVSAALILLSSMPAAAQSWFEFINREELFSVNFPIEPSVSDASYLTATGWSVPSRVFVAEANGARYSVTVVNYAGSLQEDIDAAIAHAVDTYRHRGGEVTYTGEAGVDGIEGQMVQMTNPDNGRTFVQISMHWDRLYIVDATVPEGAVVPGHFQQSLVMLDEQGRRVRYQTNEDGNKYRVIPGTGGEPFVE